MPYIPWGSKLPPAYNCWCWLSVGPAESKSGCCRQLSDKSRARYLWLSLHPSPSFFTLNHGAPQPSGSTLLWSMENKGGDLRTGGEEGQGFYSPTLSAESEGLAASIVKGHTSCQVVLSGSGSSFLPQPRQAWGDNVSPHYHQPRGAACLGQFLMLHLPLLNSSHNPI